MEQAKETQSVPVTVESPTVTNGTNETTLPSAVVDNHSINKINLFDDKQLAAAENFLTRIMRSEKGGIKSVNDGLAILMRAQDLNLPFSSCLEHIHVIQGKTGVDIHIAKALLSKAGCTWRCLKDYQPLYEYTDGINVYTDGAIPDYVVKCKSSKDAKEKAEADIAAGKDDLMYVYPVKFFQDTQGNIYKEYQLNNTTFGIAITRQQIAEIAKSGKIPVYRIAHQPVDYVTEYELTRPINGKTTTSIGRFSYTEALTAGLFEKDTYKKFARVLIGHRAFTYAARDIASDILMGVMETTELKITMGAELTKQDITSIEDVDAIEIK